VSFLRLGNRRGWIATAAVGVVAGAIAYWSGAGSGTGSATLGDPRALTISPGAPATRVSPGATASVAAVATNSNPYPVQIDSITLDSAEGTGGFGVDAGHSGCGLSTLSLTTQTNGGAGWTVPARVGSTNGSLSINMPSALAMSAGAADACQGATFTVYLVAVV
jgi:hypothetical protein